jgi:CSLREA domain-containing protein
MRFFHFFGEPSMTHRQKHLLRSLFPLFLIVFITLGSLIMPRVARAATITVTSTADAGGTCPGTNCTLRAALATVVNNDTINFNLTYPATITVGSVLTITRNNLTFDGPGADKLTISGGNTTRVFVANSALDVTFLRLKIANGRTTGTGTANSGGGFLYSGAGGGTANFNNVWFEGNTTAADGGAIFSANNSTLRIFGSVFNNNSATGTFSRAGAVFSNGTSAAANPFIVANSTFHNNSAGEQASAIRSSNGGFAMYNTTISGNNVTGTSGTKGALRITIGSSFSYTISNTIISNNTVGGSATDAAANCVLDANTYTGSDNIEFGTAASACSKPGLTFTLTNPFLGLFGTYGGNNLPVLVPNSGSPAIDAGSSAICSNPSVNSVDQVGRTRPIGLGCDIGAVEELFGNPTQPPTSTNTPTATLTPSFTPDPTATNTPSITPDPTATDTPTITPDPTATDTPTITPDPTATDTPTATSTPTNTVTNTPVPPRPDTIGVYKDGVFSLRNTNNSGAADITAAFGGDAADLPVVGDWDGNGVDTIGVYRNSTGFFFLSDSNTAPAVNYTVLFGNPGDTPFAGRWDNTMSGSGIGVYRNSNGILYQKKTLVTGFDDFFAIFGNPGDQGFAGDWDADGFDSIGVYRSSNQTWYLTNNSTPSGIVFSDIDFVFDISTNRPVVGDWDGNLTSTHGYLTPLGVFDLRPAPGAFAFGPADGRPIAGKWIAPSRPPLAGIGVNGAQPGSGGNADTGDAD